MAHSRSEPLATNPRRHRGAWEPQVRNFGPNLGNDYGGRLVGAWLDT